MMTDREQRHRDLLGACANRSHRSAPTTDQKNRSNNPTMAKVAENPNDRPKSKKELRAEKKAARKRAAAAAGSADQPDSQSKSREDATAAAEKHRLRKERRKLQLQEREKALWKQEREEKKLRKQKRRRRELHVVGGGLDPQQAQERLEEHRRKKKQKKTKTDEEGQDKAIFDKVFNGVGGDNDGDNNGFRTLEMGLKLCDMAVGKGEIARRGSLLTVQYKLTGGCFGPQGKLIDSSKKFNFRLGKGEVVRGWDVGCVGMAVGGRRRLIVPPKCGYGGEDIGAGPGALLYFDITLLACR
jgi:FKBP-type peptidyl-prolyl cis-trans isomerase